MKVEVPPPVPTAALVELSCSLPTWGMLMASLFRSVASDQAPATGSQSHRGRGRTFVVDSPLRAAC